MKKYAVLLLFIIYSISISHGFCRLPYEPWDPFCTSVPSSQSDAHAMINGGIIQKANGIKANPNLADKLHEIGYEVSGINIALQQKGVEFCAWLGYLTQDYYNYILTNKVISHEHSNYYVPDTLTYSPEKTFDYSVPTNFKYFYIPYTQSWRKAYCGMCYIPQKDTIGIAKLFVNSMQTWIDLVLNTKNEEVAGSIDGLKKQIDSLKEKYKKMKEIKPEQVISWCTQEYQSYLKKQYFCSYSNNNSVCKPFNSGRL
ncbi:MULTISPECIES: hypothetical protein [Cysteiniphilum]|uniref:Uncharacterized protein n=1 Tax=Cysteiniphilum litorale TaxID=2056700 RepID=A0A8J3E8I4_9GAMM|nr:MULTISPECIES: hypothetical protein [Cysteiniphilum]GGF91536.1 hypothetical protein GCM10010995_05960 [Cysteiniphilum litorale]